MKNQVNNAVFLLDGASRLQAVCHRHGLRFQRVTRGNRNIVERVFCDIKRRTDRFSKVFSHAERNTPENWLQPPALVWNQLV